MLPPLRRFIQHSPRVQSTRTLLPLFFCTVYLFCCAFWSKKEASTARYTIVYKLYTYRYLRCGAIRRSNVASARAFTIPSGLLRKKLWEEKIFESFFFSSFFYSLGRAIGTWIQAIAVDMILFGSMYKIYFFFKFIHSWISTHIRAANAGFIGPEGIYRGAQRNWKRKAEKNGDNACGGGPLLRLPRRPCNCEKSTRKRQGEVHVCVCVCICPLC